MEFEECLGQFQLREKWGRQWTVTKIRGKNWKNLKKLSLKRKTRVFRYWGESPISHQGKPPKHSKKKLWKNFLSVFRDWKVYPRRSRELSRENLCVPFATGPFTCEQVAKINTRTRCCSKRLGWPTTESPKQGNTIFEIFSVFVKTKYIPKTPKTLKNLFVFETTKIEHVKTHINKYNHTNEYGLHWT